MAIIFTGIPGQVVALDDPGVASTASLITVDPELSYNAQHSIITRATISQAGNYQFLHSLGEEIYVYSFGDRIGQMTLTGLSFTDCETEENGIEDILQYYSDNRLSALQDQIQVLVGTTPIQGFLVGSTIDILRPEDRIVQFSLALATLPESLS